MAIIAGVSVYFIYKNHREEKAMVEPKIAPLRDKYRKKHQVKPNVVQKSYQSEKKSTKDQILRDSKQSVKKSTIKAINTLEPKERRPFFCQLDNAIS